jgi:hypothetical protein
MRGFIMLRYATALGLIGLLPSACENSVHVKGTVEVPPEVQGKLAPGERGLVMVSAKIPKSSFPFYSVGVLCEPQSQPVLFPFDFGNEAGCANEGEITAWVERIPADASPRPECGIVQKLDNGPDHLTRPRIGMASVKVFAGNDGCNTDKAEVRVLVAP